MQVQDIMTSGLEACESTDSLLTASKKMKELNVGVVPVMENGTIVGMLTDRDIIVRAIALDRSPSQTRIKEAMTRNIVSCKADDSIEQAARIMEEYKVRRLIVQDTNGRATGVVSLGDLAVYAGEGLSGEALREVSEPSAPAR